MSAARSNNPVSLTDQEVRKLAFLARLDLTDQEVTEIQPQLAQILRFIQTLSELDTQGVEPMTTALDVDNRWRADSERPGLSCSEALTNAPSADEECFLVPAVLGNTASKRV